MSIIGNGTSELNERNDSNTWSINIGINVVMVTSLASMILMFGALTV